MKLKKTLLTILSTGVLALAACSNKGKETKKVVPGADEETYSLEQEYFYQAYNEKSLADTSRQGIETFVSKDIVFDAVTYEELVDIFESEGNYLILFGGSWCHNTRAAAAYINEYAHEYNIDTIYNFDFYLDGESTSTHIRNTNQSDPTKVTAGVEYNYLYGELVSRYLTNLDDYVEYKSTTSSALTYTNSEGIDVTVAKAQVPFLFLYNKDNTVNNASSSTAGEYADSKYPIVYGFEEMVDRDADGVYVYERNTSGERVKKYITDEYKGRLKNIFEYIDSNDITLSDYNDSLYYKHLYNQKSSKTIFAENEEINLSVLTYHQLVWTLKSEGDYLIYLGGSWCPNTQASIKTTNDYAVKNDVTIYNFDTKLDSGYAKKYWGYSKDAHIRDTSNSFVRLYTNLIELYLPNIETLYDVNAEESYKSIQYTNDEGQVVKVKKLQVPYLLAYNKDNLDADGFKAPVYASYEEMLTLNEGASDYVYSETNYASIKSNTGNVVGKYLEKKNKELIEI